MVEHVIVPSDLVEYLGAGYTEEKVAARAVLADRLVLEKWANPVEPVPVEIELVALEVAARPCRNPEGLGSWTISVDDATKTKRLPEHAARAGVYLTPDEKATLSGRKARRRYGTVRTRPGY